MRVILDETEYLGIWDKVYAEYRFDRAAAEWLRLPLPHKKYRITQYWTAEQEQIVNGIFSRLCPEKMYALDWQHDCFRFPRRRIFRRIIRITMRNGTSTSIFRAIIRTATSISFCPMTGSSVCSGIRGGMRSTSWAMR